jgi:hypothetical protein
MSNFAHIDENNIVVNVIRSDTEDNSLPQIELPEGHRWIRTSYSGSIRARFAGIGYTYNQELDKFVPPKPYASWTLNDDADWEPPIPKPDGIHWQWDESEGDWVEIPELKGVTIVT